MTADELKAYNQVSRPLLIASEKIMMIFSAKSACSSAVIWAFHRAGLSGEAQAYHWWPHKYRTDCFYKRKEVIECARFTPVQDFRIVKVMRDPIDRAASSYRHALGTGYARDAILAAIGVDTAAQGLSFQQFIDFLETEDLSTCDIHHRKQFHPFEDVHAPHRIINISRENLFGGLNEFERFCGVVPTHFPDLSWLHQLQQERTPSFSDDAGDMVTRVFTMTEAQKGPWPQNLMCESARVRLARLYASDIERYGAHL